VRKLSALLLAVASAILFITVARKGHLPAKDSGHAMAAISQTYISLQTRTSLKVPTMTDANGEAFAAKRLQGHWSIFFFGFTACPLVCPKTLSILSAIAHNPKSGISSGTTLPVFVSVDPERDSPQRIHSYLSHFDSHIVGLTGTSSDVARFSEAMGAGYQPAGSSIDHSTSLFVIDPKGRLAGVLLHPSQPSQIVADLGKLRRTYLEGESH
jgi:protein SCO1/2